MSEKTNKIEYIAIPQLNIKYKLKKPIIFPKENLQKTALALYLLCEMLELEKEELEK